MSDQQSHVVPPVIPDQPASQRQLGYLQAVAREAGYDRAALDNRAQQEFGVGAAHLSRRDASTLIDLIQSETQTWARSTKPLDGAQAAHPAERPKTRGAPDAGRSKPTRKAVRIEQT